MTKKEAAIVSAYTGIMLGEFSDMHRYVEKIMGRPVFTHEMGSKLLFAAIKKASRRDFFLLQITD